MDIGDEQQHSETDSDSLSDVGGFLSSSCMETNEKNYPFNADSGLSFTGDSLTLKMDPESETESECILNHNPSDDTSSSTHKTPDCGSESENHLLRTGSLFLYDVSSPVPQPGINNSSHQILTPNIMLFASEIGADTGHFFESNNDTCSGIKSESSQPFEIITSRSSNPVIIGNPSAAAFVKNVLKNTSAPPVLQPTYTTPTVQTLSLPPGYVILGTTPLFQTHVAQASSNRVPLQAPTLLQWPLSVSAVTSSQQSADIVNIALTAVQSDIANSSLSVSNKSDTLSTKTSSTPEVTKTIPQLTTVPDSSFQSRASSAVMYRERDSAAVDSSLTNLDLAASAPAQKALIPAQTSCHPVVISCNHPYTDNNRAMRQVIDYFLQQQNKIKLDISEDHILAENYVRGDHFAPSCGKTETTSKNAETETTVFSSVNEINIAPPVQSLGSKSGSIVLVFGKEPLHTSTGLQTSTSVLSTCSTEAMVLSSSSLGQQPHIPFENSQFEADTNSSILCTSIARSNMKDEVDSAFPPSTCINTSRTRSTAVQTLFSMSMCSCYSTEARLFDNSSSDNGKQHETENSSIGSNSNFAVEVQSVCVSSPVQIRSDDMGNQSPAANIHKLAPQTVTEKPATDISQPIFIYVVLGDGAIKQININPSPLDTTPATSITLPASSVTLQPQSHLTPDAQTTMTSKESIKKSVDGASLTCSDTDEERLKQPPARRKKKRSSYPSIESCSDSSSTKQIKCDLCSAVFTRHGNYKRHRKIHTLNLKEDQRFICPHCKRPFLQRCDMKRHMAIHTNEYPFHCSTCSKGYIRKSDLVVHERFHSKERAFKCDLCNRSFYQTGDLRRHKRSVHAEEPQLLWPCGHCNRKYTREVNLIQHVKSVHDDMLIDIADQADAAVMISQF